jgi:hypothetical protein
MRMCSPIGCQWSYRLVRLGAKLFHLVLGRGGFLKIEAGVYRLVLLIRLSPYTLRTQRPYLPLTIHLS